MFTSITWQSASLQSAFVAHRITDGYTIKTQIKGVLFLNNPIQKIKRGRNFDAEMVF